MKKKKHQKEEKEDWLTAFNKTIKKVLEYKPENKNKI